MSQYIDLLQSLRDRGVWFDCKLRLIAEPGVITEDHQEAVKQLKPLLIRQLAEEMLDHSLRQQLAAMPGDSKAKVHMLSKAGTVTHDPTKCYMWAREEKGYGWWYASQFPPPPW